MRPWRSRCGRVLIVAGLSPRGRRASGAADVIKFGIATPLSGPGRALGHSPQGRDRADLRRDQQPGRARGGRQEVQARGRRLRPQVRDRRGRGHGQPAHRQGRREVHLHPGGHRGQGRRGDGQRIPHPEPAAGVRRRAGEPEEPLHVPQLPVPAGDRHLLELDQATPSAHQARGLHHAERRHRLVVAQGGDEVRREAGLRGGGAGVLRARRDGLQPHCCCASWRRSRTSSACSPRRRAASA